MAGNDNGMPAGLSTGEATRRLAEHGPNALPQAERVSVGQRLLRQFMSPLIYVLLFALLFDAGLWVYEGGRGVPVNSLAICLILVLNAGLGVVQEMRAEEALSRLQEMAQPRVWVLRDSRLVQRAAAELVPGDVVRIEAGDRVPADGTLSTGDGVRADESLLTGESMPVEKAVQATMLSGTLLVRGKGYMEVMKTGAASTMGRLATMIGSIKPGITPLEKRLGEFGNHVALVILALGIVLTIGGIVAEGWGRIGHVILFSVALAVAAVPEGLPAIMTLTLALGVERLAGRNAIVRRLSAVEALGSVTVIATDKTGTLTENRMHVRGIDAPDEEKALRAMALANDAELGTRAGDPLEIALLDYVEQRSAGRPLLAGRPPRLSSKPFDNVDRFMRVTVVENDRHISYLKGAPETLIARSALSDAQVADWNARALAHAREGFRVLALACGDEEREDQLTFLGLVMLWDPPRREVPEALKMATMAGLRVVMITGDHPATAAAVARVIGVPAERVVTGAELDAMSAAELQAAVRDVNVFARTAPEHKLRLVEALKDAGEIVAVTGDGVNDAPALKSADVGVAMGQRGSDVSREVSDIVLMDDNFATIVTAIEQGRGIYENIQKCIRFLFSTNLALVLLITVGLGLSALGGIEDPLGGVFLPLTAVQLLWINIVADGPPALALALDRNPGVMERPPRSPSERLLDSESLRFIVVTGIAKAAMGVLLLIWLPRIGYSLDQTRTSVFLFESLAQLMFAYPSRKLSVIPAPNVAVHLAVAGGALLQLMTISIGELRTLLQLVPIDGTAIAIVLAAVVVSWAAAEAASWSPRRPSR